MADIEYFDDPNAPPAQAAGFGLAQWAGAATSVVLVIGLCVWTAQLVMRDVSDVPVIRALEGPMRVQPDDPGGQQMAHQGLAVNEIRAGGIATPAPERIVLAPPPVSLADPAPAVQIGEATPTTTTVAAPAPATLELAPLEPAENTRAALAETLSQDSPNIEDLASQLAALAEPLQPVEAVTETIPQIGSQYAVLNSARPAQRPARPARPVEQAVAEALAVPAPQPAGVVVDAPVATINTSTAADLPRSAIDVDASAIPAGTRLVQLGAFDSADIAVREWERLYGQFGDYMEGKQRLVMRARSGGRDFFRLRVVGFTGADDARRFCSAFLARNTACIPVVSR